ncbi:nicotinamide N-methyltransferase-like isoform X2 [Ambystoma mexicanum]|uniref:nicotinamide N-methyltransferase-like isoform X2 n=1 Tax=Ambystoma mexicanum TaxID=8296 RepID=UPI0037E90426
MATGMSKKELYENYYKVEAARDSFFTQDSGFVDDSLRVPMEHLFAIFSSGAVRGDTLIQYGGAIYTSLLLPVYKNYENIFIIEFLDDNVEYVNKCLDKDAKADDWNLFTKDLCNVARDSTETKNC